MIRVFLLAALGLGAGLAQETPMINAYGVVPNPPGPRRPFKPGMEVSIYGRYLGPVTPCSAEAAAASDVKELCGTVVTVAGIPANLLYVQEKQINLRVPLNVGEGALAFVVTREGRASPAVSVLFGPYRAAIRVQGTASVDMPIWIEVQLPEPLGHSLRYPVTIRPADFGEHHFEVRRNGVLIAPIAPRHGFPIVFSGLVGFGARLGLPHEPRNTARLPLHLLYRFDTPGTYEVRYVGHDFRAPSDNILVESPWIQIEVTPTPPAKRQAWLDAMRNMPSGDPVEWLSDYLPSLLAVPDAAVLPLLKDALYHPNDLVRQYTLYALYLFDDPLLADWIPATIRVNGPTPDLAYLLSWRRDLFQPRGNDIVHAVLPYLKSTSPLLCAGALQTLYFLKPHYDWKTHPEVPALLDQAVAAEAERLIGTHDPLILQPLALYLGTWKAEASRRLLRQLVAEGTVRGQAETCLRWISEDPGH